MTGAPREGRGRDALLLYDLDCGFCRFCVGAIVAWDRSRRLRPAPIQSREGQAALGGTRVASESQLASWHLADRSGTVYSGGAVFPPLLRLLPHGTRLADLALAAPALVDRLYRLVAHHRTLVSRFVPDRAKRWGDRQIAGRREATP